MKRSPEDLEKLIHGALRSLPDRRAPQSLEARVLASLATRSLPWWKQSFAHWPLAARAVFLLLSGSLAALLVLGWMKLGADKPDLASAFSTELAFIAQLRAGFRALVELCTTAVRNIPSVWLYSGLACLAALYATLFGLGATAYRTLYASR